MDKPRVVILGAGFGGAFTAKALNRQALDVEIIDDDNHFVFQPLLPEVAAGSINAADAVTPLRLLLPGVKVAQGVVIGIDFAHQAVEVVHGLDRRQLRRVPYDHLVLALGQVVDLSRFPGLAEHALTMKDLSDAFRLRNHVIDCLEQADVAEDLEARRRLLTFVVIGGGLSGIETAGELEHLIRRSLKYYPRLRRDEVRIVVAEFLPRILGELPERLAAYATRELQRRGIELALGVGVKAASCGAIELADGRVIHTRTVIATIGTGPSPLVRALPLPKLKGRVLTDRFLRVTDRGNVWAVGDMAAIPLDDTGARFAPPTAQAAVRAARQLAGNLGAAIAGRPLVPVRYESRGQLASLGGRRGVASLFGREIAGFAAWVLWRWVYLAMLPGWTSRVRVATDWLLDGLFPRNIVEIRPPRPQAVRLQRFRAGDVVFSRGEATGPLYIVLDGAFERTGADGRAAVIGPGGLFGEGVLNGERLRRTTVRARDPGACMALEPEELARFATIADGVSPALSALGRQLRQNAGE